MTTRLRGSDALSTAKVLAKAIGRESFDLVLAATESSDGYTGTMPVQLAELLGLPSITFAKAVTIDGSTVKVSRQTEEGYDEVTAPLPALVTVTAGVVEPRYASFKGIMAAKSKPLETYSVSDLGLEGQVGAEGARETITSVEVCRVAPGRREVRRRRRRGRKGCRVPRIHQGPLGVADDTVQAVDARRAVGRLVHYHFA